MMSEEAPTEPSNRKVRQSVCSIIRIMRRLSALSYAIPSDWSQNGTCRCTYFFQCWNSGKGVARLHIVRPPSERLDRAGPACCLCAGKEVRPFVCCPQLHQQLRREGHRINHKRTYRLYRKHGLSLRRRRLRRLPERLQQPLVQQLHPNQVWSMDFMSDTLVNRRAYPTFNVIDDCARDVRPASRQ